MPADDVNVIGAILLPSFFSRHLGHRPGIYAPLRPQ